MSSDDTKQPETDDEILRPRHLRPDIDISTLSVDDRKRREVVFGARQRCSKFMSNEDNLKKYAGKYVSFSHETDEPVAIADSFSQLAGKSKGAKCFRRVPGGPEEEPVVHRMLLTKNIDYEKTARSCGFVIPAVIRDDIGLRFERSFYIDTGAFPSLMPTITGLISSADDEVPTTMEVTWGESHIKCACYLCDLSVDQPCDHLHPVLVPIEKKHRELLNDVLKISEAQGLLGREFLRGYSLTIENASTIHIRSIQVPSNPAAAAAASVTIRPAAAAAASS